jgi:hypothetical protein
MEAMGPLYRDLRSRYGDDLEITVVDPRNLISVLALLVRDTRAHGLGILSALGTMFRIKLNTVIVNGRLITRGQWPESARVYAALGDPPAGWEEAAGGVA